MIYIAILLHYIYNFLTIILILCKDVEMNQGHNQTNNLITQMDVENTRVKNKTIYVLTWLISNGLSIALPIGAVVVIGIFSKGIDLNFKENYAEMLMGTICLCMNIISQLNSADYAISESVIRLIRLITIGTLATASISYGVSRTLSIDVINLEYVFNFSIGIMILTFFIGFICECNRKKEG